MDKRGQHALSQVGGGESQPRVRPVVVMASLWARCRYAYVAALARCGAVGLGVTLVLLGLTLAPATVSTAAAGPASGTGLATSLSGGGQSGSTISVPNGNSSDDSATPPGDLWFTNTGPFAVGQMNTSGASVLHTATGLLSDPAAITLGPDGNLWFLNTGNGSIGRITPSGVITQYDQTSTNIDALEDITAGPDGNLWFTLLDSRRLGRITTSGQITLFNERLTVGVGDHVGPDGALWFTNPDQDGIGGSIGSITTSGTFAIYPNANLPAL